MIDSMKKSDEVRRLQLRKDADLQELKDKTDEELRHLQVMRNVELRRMGEELTRLRNIQEIEVDSITKVRAAKDSSKEIEGETAILAQVAKDEQIQSLRDALANQSSASADMLKVRGEIVGALRAAVPSTSVSSNQAMFPAPLVPFAEKTEVSFESMPTSTPLDLGAIDKNSGDYLSEDEPWPNNARERTVRIAPETQTDDNVTRSIHHDRVLDKVMSTRQTTHVSMTRSFLGRLTTRWAICTGA
jgi:hypothetical protein